jgi:hypothetical protein
MSEREMRQVLASLCNDLDRRAKALGRGLKKVMLPAALGAGLALGAGGCSDDSQPAPNDAGIEASVKDIGAMDNALYMAPDAKADLGPQPPYMAPDGATPPPEDAAAADTAVQKDAGPVPPYMAPDMGGLLYMAPDAS